MTTLLHRYEAFMRESNGIEGEAEKFSVTKPLMPYNNGVLHGNDIQAVEWFLGLKEVSEAALLTLHKELYEGRDHKRYPTDLRRVGEYRDCYVTIGGRMLSPHNVNKDMANFWKKWPKMDSFEAHNLYEFIHPFEDLNGRTGRLLWLYKAIKEGYKFHIPFLQAYYYQTLSHYE